MKITALPVSASLPTPTLPRITFFRCPCGCGRVWAPAPAYERMAAGLLIFRRSRTCLNESPLVGTSMPGWYLDNVLLPSFRIRRQPYRIVALSPPETT